MKGKIVIIGAGITGLTAAYELSKKGYEVKIYEKERLIGGLAKSYKDEDGFIYDLGPHEFCTENKEVFSLLKELLKDDLLILHKTSSQYFFNKFVPYPLKPLDFFTKIPKKLSIIIFLEIMINRLKDLSSIEANYSFEKWTKSRFGKTLYKRYFKPYTEKVWGVNPDLLDPRTASSRISFNSVFDLLFKTIKHYITKKDDFSTIHNPLKDKFYYSKKGIGTISKRLYEECLKFGVKIKLNYETKKIIERNSKIIKINFSNGKSISNFDYVINTIPLTTLNKVLGYDYNYPLKFRSMIFGFFSFNKKQLSPYHWIYTPDKDLCFSRITEFSHLNAEMTPMGKTCITVEVPCFTTDKIWKSEDKDVINIMIKDMIKMGIITKEDNFNASITKEEHAYPIQFNGFLEATKEIVHQKIKPLKNLVTTGRQGLYKYCNMNECMEMALDVVKQIEENTNSFNYNFESKWKGAGLKQERVLKED